MSREGKLAIVVDHVEHLLTARRRVRSCRCRLWLWLVISGAGGVGACLWHPSGWLCYASSAIVLVCLLRLLAWCGQLRSASFDAADLRAFECSACGAAFTNRLLKTCRACGATFVKELPRESAGKGASTADGRYTLVEAGSKVFKLDRETGDTWVIEGEQEKRVEKT